MHGGDIYRNKVEYDFSVNTNPLGMPEAVKKELCDAVYDAEKYPDPVHEELINKTSRVIKVPGERIVYGNGASDLIMALIHAFDPKKIMITAPSFTGYKNAIQNALPDCNMVYYRLFEKDDFKINEDIAEAIKSEGPEMLFLTNPNNPNGRLIDKKVLGAVLDVCESLGIAVVIDECFMPLTGMEQERSLIYTIDKYKFLIVLRAFTKTFAMAGVRLGYAVFGSTKMADKVRKHLSEWNLSVFAQRAGIKALESTGYIDRSVNYIQREREFLIENLEQSGIKTYTSNANYILFKCSILDLKERLLERGMLIRDCLDYEGLGEGFFRIAVRMHEENIMLISSIRGLFD